MANARMLLKEYCDRQVAEMQWFFSAVGASHCPTFGARVVVRAFDGDVLVDSGEALGLSKKAAQEAAAALALKSLDADLLEDLEDAVKDLSIYVP